MYVCMYVCMYIGICDAFNIVHALGLILLSIWAPALPARYELVP